VKDPSGNATTEIAVVTVIGASGMELESGLKAKIYPNPTYGNLHLELSDYADELKVMDITGKIVLNRVNLDRNETVDLSGFNNGIYLIHLKSGDDVIFHKVVKR
jgi:hypothetical protein